MLFMSLYSPPYMQVLNVVDTPTVVGALLVPYLRWVPWGWGREEESAKGNENSGPDQL